MFVNLPKGVLANTTGTLAYIWKELLFLLFLYLLIFILQNKLYLTLEMASLPTSILGVALSIIIGFRNNSAYDRWWEARKIWGGIVNYSRTLAMQAITYPSPQFGEENEHIRNRWSTQFIYRHIAWINALRLHLRKHNSWQELNEFLPAQEYSQLDTWINKPTQINLNQGKHLQNGFEKGIIEHFRHMSLAKSLEELYNLQGKCERIKNTPFPKYYDFFTRIFMWVFLLLLPFALSDVLNFMMIPLGLLISFVYLVLEKTGRYTENPFENKPQDISMTALCRTIEIDLRQMLNEDQLPEPFKPKNGILM